MQSLERIPERLEEPGLQFLIFQLGAQNFALEIHRVKEILRNKDVTPFPGAAPYIEGAIEVRGKIVPVFDLRKRLGIARSPEPGQCRILIVTAARKTVGMIVDAVHRVVSVFAENIEAAPEVSTGMSYCLALLKTEDELLVILDLEAIATSHAPIVSTVPGN